MLDPIFLQFGQQLPMIMLDVKYIGCKLYSTCSRSIGSTLSLSQSQLPYISTSLPCLAQRKLMFLTPVQVMAKALLYYRQ